MSAETLDTDAAEGRSVGTAATVPTVAADRTSAIPPNPPLRRLEFLDALRGLAALYVLLYHMVYIPEPDLELPMWARMVIQNGGMGVSLFFVVSAFSLCYTMPLRMAEPRPWVSFFVHRFFRIAPLFYLWIVLSIVRDWNVSAMEVSYAEIASSVLFVFNLTKYGQEGFVWAGWTIGVEMAFYALFPLLFLFARSAARAICAALVLLVLWYAILGLLPYFTEDAKAMELFAKWNFLRYLPVFACGLVVYHLFMPDGSEAAGEKGGDTGLLLLALSLYLFTAMLNGWLPTLFGDYYYWQGVVFAALLLGLARSPLRLLVNRATTYLGRISYSLYLGHSTVIFFLGPVYVELYDRIENVTVFLFAATAITLCVAIPLSEATYRLVEEPGIQLGKRVNRALRARWRG